MCEERHGGEGERGRQRKRRRERGRQRRRRCERGGDSGSPGVSSSLAGWFVFVSNDGLWSKKTETTEKPSVCLWVMTADGAGGGTEWSAPCMTGNPPLSLLTRGGFSCSLCLIFMHRWGLMGSGCVCVFGADRAFVLKSLRSTLLFWSHLDLRFCFEVT